MKLKLNAKKLSAIKYIIETMNYGKPAGREFFDSIYNLPIDYIPKNTMRYLLYSTNFSKLRENFSPKLLPLLEEYFDISPHIWYEEKTDAENKMEHYRFIPYNLRRFVSIMSQTIDLDKKSFIDIGHGTGDKVSLARIVGQFDTVTGVEYNKFTYNISINIRSRQCPCNTTLINGDAIDINYANYDYIYMFKPMQTIVQMEKLYRSVLYTAPIGALIINVLDFKAVFNLDEFAFYGSESVQPFNMFYIIKISDDEFNVHLLDRN